MYMYANLDLPRYIVYDDDIVSSFHYEVTYTRWK